MSKSICNKYILVIMLIAASIMTIYWYIAGETLLTSIAIGLAVICAALPLPMLLGRYAALYQAQRVAASYGATCSSPEVIALLGDVDTIVLPRRSLLYRGRPLISQLVPEGLGQEALLEIAAAAEGGSGHIYAQTIRGAIENRHLSAPLATGHQEFPGRGVEAMVGHFPVYVGRRDWIESEGVQLSADLLTRADQLSTHGEVPVFVGRACFGRGIIAFIDEPSAGMTTALAGLRDLGLRLILLTSSDRRLAHRTVRDLGLDEARSGLTAIAKAREVQLLRATGATVAAIAADERDSLALAEADVIVRLQRHTPADTTSAPPMAADRQAVAADGPSRMPWEPAPSTAHPRAAAEDTVPPQPPTPAAARALPAIKAAQPPSSEKAAAKTADSPRPEAAPATDALSLAPTVTLTGRSLYELVPLIELGRHYWQQQQCTRRITIIADLVTVPCAMGLLHAFGGPLLSPIAALGINMAVALAASLQALRLR